MSSHEKDEKNGGEVEPFLERQTTPQFIPDTEPPKDNGRIVWLVMFLHGIGVLIAWNVFITVAPMYYTDFKLKPAEGEQPPKYVSSFMNNVCICSQLPNLIINLIGMFASGGNLMIRIVICLVIVAASCLFTIAFIYVDVSNWQFGFFIVTMVTVVIMNTANGLYQNSIYGLVGSFPFEYINAVVLGNNICGLAVTVLLLITTTFIKDTQLNVTVFFSIAFLLLVICIISFIRLRKNPYFTYQMALARRASENHGKITMSDYFETFKGHWLPLIDVALVFFVTLMLFPSILLGVKLYPLGRPYDLPIPGHLYPIIVIFLNFNLFTVIGSKCADYFRWPSPKYAWIPVFARLIFLPLFFACNYAPQNTRSWPVYIPNEYAFFILISLMSITHGYYSSITIMYAPHGAEPMKARILGKMSAFFLVLGIAIGIGCSFLAIHLA
uniref:NADH dehydrogenase subunit 2 n=2 Tax=Panagrolaimus sp. JU765 TaxID=591449 RepID=A0AC34Q9H4_9BILA